MLTLAVPAAVAVLAHAGHVHDLGGTKVPLPFLAVPAVVVGGVLPARAGDRRTAAMVLCSAGAGTIHAAVTPAHFQESVLFGLFFLAVTVGQMGVVVAALHRPSRLLWASAVAGNVVVLAVWALSRTAGLPLGPHPWSAEPTGLLDLACAAYEIGIVVVALRLVASGTADERSVPAAGRAAVFTTAVVPALLPLSARPPRRPATHGRRLGPGPWTPDVVPFGPHPARAGARE